MVLVLTAVLFSGCIEDDSDNGNDAALIPELKLTLEPLVINHSATVLPDGSVNQTTEVVSNLTLENLDGNETANRIEIELELPLELQVWSTTIYIKVGLIIMPLFKDSKPHTFQLAFWPPKAKETFELVVRFNETAAGTYSDGGTYVCVLELTQVGKANYTSWKRIVSFTIIT